MGGTKNINRIIEADKFFYLPPAGPARTGAALASKLHKPLTGTTLINQL